jgi:hypothetical protein
MPLNDTDIRAFLARLRGEIDAFEASLVVKPEPEPDLGVVLDATFDGPDAIPYLTAGSPKDGWLVEGGSAAVNRVGGCLVKRDTRQFHRMFSTERFGGPGKKLTLSYRGRATAIRNRSGSTIIEGAKTGLKFPVRSLSQDDARSVFGTGSQSDPKSPGSYIFLTGLTEGGYMELSRNGYAGEGYKFFANKRVGYNPGDWLSITVTVEWLGPDIRVCYFHDDKQVYEAVDKGSPFAGEPGFLWLRTDDADWEYDYIRMTETGV